jgi:hypothetical protein
MIGTFRASAHDLKFSHAEALRQSMLGTALNCFSAQLNQAS